MRVSFVSEEDFVEELKKLSKNLKVQTLDENGDIFGHGQLLVAITRLDRMLKEYHSTQNVIQMNGDNYNSNKELIDHYIKEADNLVIGALTVLSFYN